MAKIAVVGLGYVGLANALLLAKDNAVIGIDVDAGKVAALAEGRSPIQDTEISEFLARPDLDFSVTTDLAVGVVGADFVILSVPTDYSEVSQSFDTALLERVITQVAALNETAALIIKSTLPVGFTDGVNAQFNAPRVIFSPEFLREGRALYDNLHPSRIIVGEASARGQAFADLLRQGAESQDVPVLLTSSSEAEAIKLFANSYLAMRVAFMNEVDTYALSNGLDAENIIRGITADPRIGAHYRNPSFGYGGYCLPKDSKQLLSSFGQTPQNLIGAIVEANQTRMAFIARQILATGAKTIGIHRLHMKAGSDNFRQSSILQVLSHLQAAQVEVRVYEPLLGLETFEGCVVEDDLARFKQACDLIICNRWSDSLADVESKVFTRDVFGMD